MQFDLSVFSLLEQRSKRKFPSEDAGHVLKLRQSTNLVKAMTPEITSSFSCGGNRHGPFDGLLHLKADN